jgi:hypothetical protein
MLPCQFKKLVFPPAILLFVLCTFKPACIAAPVLLWEFNKGSPQLDDLDQSTNAYEGGIVASGNYAYTFGPYPSMKTIASKLWLVCLDPDKNIRWDKKYGPEGSVVLANDIEQTDDGYYIVAASYKTNANTPEDAWILKINRNGDTIWTRTFGTDSSDGCKSIAPTQGGGVIGLCYSYFDGGNIIVCLSRNGDTLWTRHIPPNEAIHSPMHVIVNDDQTFITIGEVHDSISRIKMMAYTTDGFPTWSKTYSDTLGKQINAIEKVGNDGYIIAVKSTVPNLSRNGAFDEIDRATIVRIDSHGELLWTTHSKSDSARTALGVAVLTDGNFLVCGTIKTRTGNVLVDRPLIYKLNAAGNQQWAYIHPLESNSLNETERVSWSIVTDSNSEFYVSGWAWMKDLDNAVLLPGSSTFVRAIAKEIGKGEIFDLRGRRLNSSIASTYGNGIFVNKYTTCSLKTMRLRCAK